MRHVSELAARWQRLVLTMVGIFAVLVLVTLVGWLAGMSPEYGGAQYSSAARLVQRDDWGELRHDAVLDIVVFVPAYLIAGAALTWLVLAASTTRNVAVSLLVFTAVADVVETLLFHRSLTRLIDGSDEDGIAAMVTLTHIASWLKYGALGLAAAILIAFAARGDRSRVG